jgi:hypothetical protein
MSRGIEANHTGNHLSACRERDDWPPVVDQTAHTLGVGAFLHLHWTFLPAQQGCSSRRVDIIARCGKCREARERRGLDLGSVSGPDSTEHVLLRILLLKRTLWRTLLNPSRLARRHPIWTMSCQRNTVTANIPRVSRGSYTWAEATGQARLIECLFAYQRLSLRCLTAQIRKP